MDHPQQYGTSPATQPDPESRPLLCPAVMTEEELIHFLRIPEISNATDYRHVVDNLKRRHGLPRIHLCGKTVYLTDSIRHWLQQHVSYGN
jgi:hypothetical protein